MNKRQQSIVENWSNPDIIKSILFMTIKGDNGKRICRIPEKEVDTMARLMSSPNDYFKKVDSTQKINRLKKFRKKLIAKLSKQFDNL